MIDPFVVTIIVAPLVYLLVWRWLVAVSKSPHDTRIERIRHWVGYRDHRRLCDGTCGRKEWDCADY